MIYEVKKLSTLFLTDEEAKRYVFEKTSNIVFENYRRRMKYFDPEWFKDFLIKSRQWF